MFCRRASYLLEFPHLQSCRCVACCENFSHLVQCIPQGLILRRIWACCIHVGCGFPFQGCDRCRAEWRDKKRKDVIVTNGWLIDQNGDNDLISLHNNPHCEQHLGEIANNFGSTFGSTTRWFNFSRLTQKTAPLGEEKI
jgi:hypothetical protein